MPVRSKKKPVPKRRRKKKHYKTGVHRSPKCPTRIEYRSGWELVVCKWLDKEPSVLEYGYEPLTIPYLANLRTKKVRSYYPDFLITYTDGTKKLVEVKRVDKLSDPKVIKKAKAAELWCAQQSPPIKYEIWCDNVISAMRKMNEANAPSPKPKRARKRIPRKRTNSSRTRKKV